MLLACPSVCRSQKVTGVSPSTNLHSFWDSGVGQWSTTIPRPLNAAGKAWLVNISSVVRDLFPANSLANNISVTDPMAWAEESFDFAKEFVYTAPQAPTSIPSAYIREGQDIALMRIAVAGYRLATAL
jgi:hypothetical protein